MNSCNRVFVIVIFAISLGPITDIHAQQTHHVNVSINQGPACQVVGVNEEISFEYQLYPNPTKDELTIVSSKSNTRVSVLDLFGRAVVSETTLVENKIRLNLRALTRGFYYVRLESEGSTHHTKIMIHE